MDTSSFFNFNLINTTDILLMLVRLTLDMVSVFIIVRLIYFRIRKNRSYLFTITIFNVLIFLVCYMLSHLTLSLGFSFGIFAIFSILRYRTMSIPIKEMTYLFIGISLAVINSLSNDTISLVGLVLTNALIVGVTFFLEKAWMRNELMKYIVYEKIDLVKPQNHGLLLSDLKERTGLDIHRFEIGKIDFLRDISELRVYYYSSSNTHFVNEEKDNDDDD